MLNAVSIVSLLIGCIFAAGGFRSDTHIKERKYWFVVAGIFVLYAIIFHFFAK